MHMLKYPAIGIISIFYTNQPNVGWFMVKFQSCTRWDVGVLFVPVDFPFHFCASTVLSEVFVVDAPLVGIS